jgi:hypothetical protein
VGVGVGAFTEIDTPLFDATGVVPGLSEIAALRV